MRKTHEFYRLTAAAAAQIESEVRTAFEDWTSIARKCCVQRREIERLEAVIDPTIDE